jgi:cytochrome c biogenesis protein
LEKGNQRPVAEKRNALWSFLASVRLTVILLIVIAVSAILGTVIPQQEEAQRFLRDFPPGPVSVLQFLQIFDMYHSVWFLLMMALLAVNLTVCSVNRFPRTWRIFQAARSEGPASPFERAAADRVFSAPGPPAREAERLEAIIRKRFGKVRRAEDKGSITLHGEKGAFSYFGVYVVHMSILIILAGAIIGSLSGFDGYVNIPEGDTVDTVKLRGGQGTKKLDFAVRCDRFTVEFYENGMPREFRSDLAFLRDGKIVYEGPLRVNHPIEFGGIRFYQSSYGSTSGKAHLTVADGAGRKKLVKVAAGEQFELPGRKAAVSVLRVEENLMNMGPAVKLGIMSEKGGIAFWVFRHIREIEEANPGITKHVPQFNPGLFKPYVFSLSGIESVYFTGLQVNTDPGVPIVAAGAILMVAGFMIVFLFSHRQVWVRVEEKGGKCRVSLVGRCNRDPAGLARGMDALTAAEIK